MWGCCFPCSQVETQPWLLPCTPAAKQAKRVLWGEVQPACDASVIKMDYKQLCKYIKR